MNKSDECALIFRNFDDISRNNLDEYAMIFRFFFIRSVSNFLSSSSQYFFRFWCCLHS